MVSVRLTISTVIPVCLVKSVFAIISWNSFALTARIPTFTVFGVSTVGAAIAGAVVAAAAVGAAAAVVGTAGAAGVLVTAGAHAAATVPTVANPASRMNSRR